MAVEGDWVPPLVRGVAGLIAFVAGLFFARRHLRSEGPSNEPFDSGLD